MHGSGHGFSPILWAFLSEELAFYLNRNFVSSLFRIPAANKKHEKNNAL
jgi:hypothetical protein